MDQTSRIVVRRVESEWSDRNRSFWIEIDGARVGKIKRGEQEFRVAPGRHRVRAAIDWSGSPVVDVDVPDGGTARLRVQSLGNPLLFWKAFTRTGYLGLAVE